MADFINTIDALGDDAVVDSIIEGSITEFMDDTITDIPSYAFVNCKLLTVFHTPLVTSIGIEAFQDAGVKKLCFPNLILAGAQAFRSMNSLEYVDLPVCTRIGALVFYMTGTLKTLILRSNTMCTLDNVNALQGNWSGNTPQIAKGTGYVYVPRALVDSYKAATNWSTYADQFRALEDYTVDGTTTGELDETKI